VGVENRGGKEGGVAGSPFSYGLEGRYPAYYCERRRGKKKKGEPRAERNNSGGKRNRETANARMGNLSVMKGKGKKGGVKTRAWRKRGVEGPTMSREKASYGVKKGGKKDPSYRAGPARKETAVR